jgi:hypothetical protein
MKNKIIKLRAHHLMCIEGFGGHGYNAEFVANMKRVISELKNNPEVIVIDDCDDLCSKCPNMKDGICVNSKGGDLEVKRMDGLVLSKLSFKSLNKFFYNDLRKKIIDNFRTKKDLDGICSNCSWKRICKWYKTRE